ncbi:hypothetical protein PM035_17015 [Halorubrum ezzemoulense]|uniref:hypothetical protein n=1 Tax=Halorubrum ezzemoulense TaxID=337243 RepID=UPI00232F1AEB|nr:hypothetical protein [Halorubrum ezzemoulense]MDB2269343.1 hypothetical protein [Halorubrum ezzemoulense]
MPDEWVREREATEADERQFLSEVAREAAARDPPSPREMERVEDDLPTPDSTYYGETVKIPGTGSAPNRCRGLSPVGFCEGGHVALGRSSCDTRYCPDHYLGWVRDGAASACERLAAYRAAADGWEKRLLHVVASPTADRVSADRFWSMRSEAQDVVQEAGVRGGYCIAHPYRTSAAADELFRTAVQEGDLSPETGRWTFLRRFAGGDWDKWQSMTEAGPHYHFLAACEDFDPEAVPDGWVVKNVRSFSRFEKRDLESFEDMARAAWYLRTHGAAEEFRQTATWFGDMHPSAFDPEEELGASEWHFIQERAAEAVGVPIEEMRDGAGAGEEERICEVEDCEEILHDLEDLAAFTSDASWMRSIPPKRRHRLRAVEIWMFEESVIPPPSVRSSEAKVQDWLLETGRMYSGHSKQTGLKAFDQS